MTAFMENFQKFLCIDGCSPIQGRRSLRISNLGDKSLKKKKDISPWIGEQQCMQTDLKKKTFSRTADISVITGKLLEIHLHAWLFSNPRGKFLIIDGISCTPDLRVQHKRTSRLIERISLGTNSLKKYVSNTNIIYFAALSSSKGLAVHQSVCLLVVRLWEKVTFRVSDTTKT